MNNDFNKSESAKNWPLIILSVIAVGTVIIIGRDFIYPISLAILFSYLIYPLAVFVESYIKNRTAATIISVITAIAVIAGLAILLYEQLSFFVQDADTILKQAKDNIQNLQKYLTENTPINFDQKSLKESMNGVFSEEGGSVKKIVSATTGTLVGLGLQPIFIFFMLCYRDHFREFLVKIVDSQYHEKLSIILHEIASVTKNYVSGVFLVVLILCVLNSLGLLIVGIKYPIMFGILSAVMNFIPYFGTLIGGAIPLLYALASDEPHDAIGIVILFLIIQFTENNILTPNITGGRVAINPLFTILIIILGGMAWGIPGMFVSVPFLGMFKVVCTHVDSLKPIAFLISPKDDQMAKGWATVKKIFAKIFK